jgi:hypothetical protein
MPATKKLNIVKPHPDAIAALRSRSRHGARLAPGFHARKDLNLSDHGGRRLNDLKFANFYLGHWSASDMTSIDSALSGALTDPKLNHVMQQYFPSPVTTEFLGSSLRGDSSLVPGATYNRDNVHATLARLSLAHYDLSDTVICLYLPQGVILDTRSARPGGVGDDRDKDGDGNTKKSGHVIGDKDDADDSTQGLGGYHGSAQINGKNVLFAVAVYSDESDGEINGIPVWPDSWKNVVATMYHELNEARTDPDVEAAMRGNDDSLLGWYSDNAGEIGDIPMEEAGQDLAKVMVEVALLAGGTVPIQLMWSNEVGGPGLPY